MPVGLAGGAWCECMSAGAWVMSVMATFLVRLLGWSFGVLGDEADESVDLVRGHRLLERAGHHPGLVPGGDVRVRVDDRLVDEVRQILAGLLRGRPELVERGADLAGRTGNGLELVAGAAPVLGEERDRGRRGAAARTTPGAARGSRAAAGGLPVLAAVPARVGRLRH